MMDDTFARALVVGSPGSGKSTFARALHARTGLPLYYLDMLRHLPDHTEVPNDIFDARLIDILAQPRWIIDGNYGRTLPLRLRYADTVFWFDLPVAICLDGIRERIGKPREDMPWEPEKELDPKFEEYVRTFPDDKRPMLEGLLGEAEKAGVRLFVFTTREEAHRYIRSLPFRE